ncbi:MAG TPA: 2-C-methyl-D-erythritol 4-phosphate cytidylyltransferase, partial [Gaiellales bacterium]
AAVAGGATRAASVSLGLAALPDSARFVLVHDAARPLISAAVVGRVVSALAAGADAVIPGVAVADTIKRVAGGVVVETLRRDDLVAVQTPQGFRRDVLVEALAGEHGDATDCATLAERAGRTVTVVEGDLGNYKITTPADLARAEAQ